MSSEVDQVLDVVRPEWRAGGYARDNNTLLFYVRVNSLLRPDMVVLDLGAGRGEVFHVNPTGLKAKYAKLQGKVAKVIGVDVDETINDHPYLDERHVLKGDGAMPVADKSIDIAVAEWVFEHVEKPERMSAELDRIIKPGGWVCAVTPNRIGYVGTGARLLPNRLHKPLLKGLMPGREEIDVFPTVYRINSIRDVHRYFPNNIWENYSYIAQSTPRYFGKSVFLFRMIDFFQSIVPPIMKTDLIVLLRKREPV